MSSPTAVASSAAAAPAPRSRPDWLQWADRGAWAVADQGLFASSNFLLIILFFFVIDSYQKLGKLKL